MEKLCPAEETADQANNAQEEAVDARPSPEPRTQETTDHTRYNGTQESGEYLLHELYIASAKVDM